MLSKEGTRPIGVARGVYQARRGPLEFGELFLSLLALFFLLSQ